MLFDLSHCLSVGRPILPTVALCPPLFLSVLMSDEVYYSSVVASVVDERGIKFFGSGILPCWCVGGHFRSNLQGRVWRPFLQLSC